MKRQRRTIGSILEIDLGNGYFNYAQIINDDILFFDVYVKEKLDDITSLDSKSPLFFLGVYDDIVTKGRWKIVGKLPIKDAYKNVPLKFIQDAIDKSRIDIYNPNTGEIKKGTKKQAEGLECAAVWEAEHVESRLRDHYAGRENIWVNQLKLK